MVLPTKRELDLSPNPRGEMALLIQSGFPLPPKERGRLRGR